MIPLFKPFMADQALANLADTLYSGYIGEGERVHEFEKKLEYWTHWPTLAVNSGTSALWLACDVAGIRRGDYVITTPVTCLATNIPLAHLGAIPLWADVDPHTGLIDHDQVLYYLNHLKVKAVITVDYGGIPCNHDILYLCWDHGIPLIEDCAHSFGANQNTDFDCRAYSFQAIKTLTTGDGGALVIRNDDKREEARLKRWFGLDRNKGGFRCDQIVRYPGYKFHMTDIAASIGLANLQEVERNINTAKRHAYYYAENGLGSYYPDSSCWLHTLLVDDRNSFIKLMAERGIECARTHSRNDVHPIFSYAPRPTLPGVDEFDRKHVEIPVGWHLSDKDVIQVAKTAQECLEMVEK